MLKNYLLVSFRNFRKHKGHTLINTIGLTVGMVVCLLLFFWVKDEWSFDQFHQHSDRTYRALWEARYGDNEWKIPLVPVPLGPTLQREFPEVEAYTHIYQGGLSFKQQDEFIRESNIFFVDSNFFDIFTVKVLEGNVKKDITSPNAIFITPQKAKQYFGDQNPIGKVLEMSNGDQLEIKGVIEPFPDQSHMQYDFIGSLNRLSHIEKRKDEWGAASVYTYFLMKEGSDPNALQQKLQAFIEQGPVGESFKEGNNYTSFPFQPLTSIHLHSNLEFELGPNGNSTYVRIFTIAGIIILILACINFINLSSAQSLTRAKEIGIRKVLGSQKQQIIQQFFVQIFLQVILSVGLAILITEFALPYFNAFSGKSIQLEFLGSFQLWAFLLILIFAVTTLVGIGPSLFLSSFSPVKVLKGNIFRNKGKHWGRRGLVVTQFCLSICLIISTLVINNQFQYLQNKRLGFDKEHVLIFERASGLGNQFQTFIQEAGAFPFVQHISATQTLPGKAFDSTIFGPEQPANYETTSLNYCFADDQLVEVLKLDVSEGRNFSRKLSTDSMTCLINESAVERLGWSDPIGKTLQFGGARAYKVVGVIENFNYRSLHHEVEPLVILNTYRPMSFLAIRLQSGNVKSSIEQLKNKWKEVAPNLPLSYSFLDEDYGKLYEAEQKMASLFIFFALLAIFIACMGLFGLVSFLTTQRTKEIGIRKVLGASKQGIVSLFTKDFIKLVFVAFLLAIPICWLLLNNWLENFAFRIDLSWWQFALGGALAIVIAFITVGVKSLQAAMLNPAKTLKQE